MLASKTSKRNSPSAAHEIILEAKGGGEGGLKRPPLPPQRRPAGSGRPGYLAFTTCS